MYDEMGLSEHDAVKVSEPKPSKGKPMRTKGPKIGKHDEVGGDIVLEADIAAGSSDDASSMVISSLDSGDGGANVSTGSASRSMTGSNSTPSSRKETSDA